MEEKISYYNTEKVTSIKALDRKTSMGSQLHLVSYGENQSVVLTDKNLNKVITEEPRDERTGLNDLRNDKCYLVVAEILAICENHNLNLAEFAFTIDQTVNSLNASTELASNKLFGVEYPEKRTFIQIDDILKEDTDTV